MAVGSVFLSTRHTGYHVLGEDREASCPREEADFAVAPRPLAFAKVVTCPLMLYLIIYHVLALSSKCLLSCP